MIANRLKKNWDRLKPMADKLGVESFRLYDRDIPEFPSIIEVHRDYAVLWDRREAVDQGKEANFTATLDALHALGFDKQHLIIKRREVQHRRGEGEGLKQYTKRAKREVQLQVREGTLRALINLHDYLDTGLFLDHRIVRARLAQEVSDRKARGQNVRALNLFSYTGMASVAMAKSGARVTSVDMSPVYSAWAERNFIANGLLTAHHDFIVENALDWIRDDRNRFDLIFCDPPTFSNSKKMVGTWDVQRDHRWLIDRLMERLKPGGTLVFSTNKRDFKIDAEIAEHAKLRDLSKSTLPFDFRDQKLRRVWWISALESPAEAEDPASDHS